MTVIEKITTINDQTVLILSPELLAELGLSAGDEVEVAMVDKTITIRPVDDGDEDAEFESIANRLIQERKHVYKVLAQGVDE